MLLIYWMMTLCCCLYAICAGGPEGRMSAGLIALKTVTGFYAGLMDQSWKHTHYWILMVDVACLLAFLMLSLRSRRLWPLWMTGCALAAVTVHIASIGRLRIDPMIYQALKDVWAIPMQLFMVRGIVLDARYRRSSSPTKINSLALFPIWKGKWRR